jgi:hypothetical protein
LWSDICFGIWDQRNTRNMATLCTLQHWPGACVISASAAVPPAMPAATFANMSFRFLEAEGHQLTPCLPRYICSAGLVFVSRSLRELQFINPGPSSKSSQQFTNLAAPWSLPYLYFQCQRLLSLRYCIKFYNVLCGCNTTVYRIKTSLPILVYSGWKKTTKISVLLYWVYENFHPLFILKIWLPLE